MPLIQDQIGNTIKLNTSPARIISLVPSITEYLYDLGLGERVVGITKFCVHPSDWLTEKVVVGGTKQQHLKKIRNLNPDLIIASKEENVKSYVEKLAKNCPVYVSDVSDFESALEMMKDIGELTGEANRAAEITANIRQQFNFLERSTNSVNVAYCIWKKPWMWAGTDTFISKMMASCGFENVIDAERYPEVDMQEIVEANPDFIFLSSEPFPFQDQHIDELKADFPEANFTIVDGEMFSWYGSRMLKAPEYFASLRDQLKSK
jgi:ABC-type Fe3+-hydroxamate transport system substrate-binding protein